MPVINRLRLVNVRYDRGTKMFGDDIFALDGENTLFNLTNGGGKTVLLQLVMQVVLPREDLGTDRRFASFFEGPPNRTSHILVEWILDGAARELLLTGFCATTDPDRERGVRWFTYVRRTSDTDPLNLASLPLIDDQRHPRSFHDLRRSLRESRNAGFQVFADDERPRYHELLTTYGILPAEWQAIKRINLTEGGIEAFFEGCRTSRHCLERVLIPTVEEQLTHAATLDRDSLPRLFERHFETLQRIPVMEQQRETLARFRQHAERLLQAVTDLDRAGEAFCTARARLEAFNQWLDGELRTLQSTIEERERHVREMEQQIAEQAFRQESLQLFHRRRLLEEGRRQEEALRKQRDESALALDGLKERERRDDAVQLFRRLERVEGECRQLERQLAEVEADTDQDTLLQELHTCEASLLALLRREEGSVAARLQELKREQADLQNDLERLRQEHSTLTGDRLAREKSIGAAEARERSLQEDLDRLWEPFLFEERLDQESTRTAWQARHDKTAAGLVAAEETLQNLETREQEHQARVEEHHLEAAAALRQEEGLRKDREAFEEARNAILQCLARFQWETDDPWNPAATRHLEGALQERAASRREAQARLASSREQLALQENRSWFVVNSDIERLRNALKEHGLSVIAGGEYLAALPDEATRAQALAGAPLLPYGLVVSGWEPEILAAVSLPDIPVRAAIPLLRRENLQAADPQPPGFLRRLDDGTWLIEHSGRDVFLHPERLQEYVRELTDRVRTEQDNATQLDLAVDELRGAAGDLERFRQNHPHRLVGELAERAQAVQRSQENLAQQASALDLAMHELRETRKRTHATQADLTRRLTEATDRLHRLTTIAEKQPGVEKEQATLRHARAAQEQLGSQLQKVKTSMDQAEQRAQKFLLRIDRGQTRLRDLREQIESIRLPEDFPVPETEAVAEQSVTYLEQVRTGLRERLSGATRRREDLLASISERQSQQRRYEEDLLRLGIPREQLTGQDPATEEERCEWRRKIEREQEDLHTLDRSLKEKGRKLDREQGRWEEAAHRLEQQAERPPAVDFPEDLDREERRLADLKTHLESVRQAGETELNALRGQEQDLTQESSRLAGFFANLPDIRAGETSTAESALPRPEWTRDRATVFRKEGMEACRNSQRRYEEAQAVVRRRRLELQEQFGNTTYEALRRFIQSLSPAGTADSPFEHPTRVREGLEQCFELIDRLDADCTLQLENANRDRQELTDICQGQVRRVLEELGHIERNAQASIGGRAVKMVEVHLDRPEEEVCRRRLQDFLERLVTDLVRENPGQQERLRALRRHLGIARLLHETCNLDRARIKVRKPAQPPQRPRTADWEEVPRFSGGEKYVCYFAMYIALMSYIRNRQAPGGSTKVILADNPFGRMSADFLLQGVFTLARSTRTQMICFTALKESTVLQFFPRLFSMVLRPNADGREVMISESISVPIETGHMIMPHQQLLF